MTPRQIELARHALGLPNRDRKSHRNRFIAGYGHADYPDWIAMVASGDAIRFTCQIYGGDDYFYLTAIGARSVLLPREKLSKEDFPPGKRAITLL